jgi:hypothetical protein
MAIGRLAVAAWAAAQMAGSAASGAFVEYKQDKAGWESAVGSSFTTLDFNFGQPVVLTDQYQHLGALFPEGNEITLFNPGGFLNDGWGLTGGFGTFPTGPIVVEFTQPMNWIAVEHPGLVEIALYDGDQLLYTSTISGLGPGASFFMGLATSSSFNKAVIRNPLIGFVYIDDLYFGAPIPAPGCMVGLLGVMLITSRRRRVNGTRSWRGKFGDK